MITLKRLRGLFQYSLDAYFVFRSSLGESHQKADIEYPVGYSVRELHSLEDEAGESLRELWQMAYEADTSQVSDRSRRTLAGLFADGDICCGLFHGDSLVGMDWVGFSGAIMRMHFSRFIKREQGAAIGHHTYITPAHRGFGLQRMTDAARRTSARAAGCSTVYVFVGVKNFSSLKNMFRSHEQYRLIYHLKIDLPMKTLDLFPAVQREPWQDCQRSLQESEA
jgi:hypothetical protein